MATLALAVAGMISSDDMSDALESIIDGEV